MYPLRFRSWFTCFALLGLLVAGTQANETIARLRYTIPVPALQLVTSEADFAPFARRVYQDVEAALRASPSDTAELKLLLGLRVHLALHFRDDSAALDAAERIRNLQSDPAERALAGLTTRAVVAAHHKPLAFKREFSRLLEQLPRTPEIRTALTKVREKIEGITEQSLLDEVRTRIAPRLQRGEPCTLEIADQLVRVRHRLQDIVPLRAALLRAYDAAIAARK